MLLTGDYHTHTIYSSGKFKSKHAKGTILENAEIAKNKGINELGITEHGLSHIFFGLQKSNISKMRNEIEVAKAKTGINILLGIEANFISADGDIDLSEEEIKLFDYIAVGFHKFVKMKRFKDYFIFSLPNILGIKTKKIINRNTMAICNAMRKYPIKFITHPGASMPFDFERVIKVAEETNTLFEINGKRIEYTKQNLDLINNSKINLIINSDAHKSNKVGEVNKPLNFAIKNKINLNKIINLK